MNDIKRKAFALIELLVVAIIIVVVFAVIFPIVNRMRSSAAIVGCADNLKAIAEAMQLYSQDYHDTYPRSGPANAYWARHTGWKYEKPWPSFKEPEYDGKPLGASITSCWYLLVRYCQMYPYQFVCKSSGDTGFTYSSPYADFREIWDFGDNPYAHCSYSMQNPFGQFPASPFSPADKPIAADKSPWFDGQGCIVESAPNNSRNHKGKGQNILFGDSHIKFSKTSLAGIDDDGIYTYGQDDTPPTDRNKENDAQNEDDSFLAI